MSAADFRKLADLFPDEAVTHSYVCLLYTSDAADE